MDTSPPIEIPVAAPSKRHTSTPVHPPKATWRRRTPMRRARSTTLSSI